MGHFTDDRPLGITGETGYRIYPTLDLAGQSLHVVIGLRFYDDRSQSLPCRRANLFHPIQVMHSLFNTHADLLLNFTGAGAGIRQRNAYFIDHRIGKELLIKRRQTGSSTNQQKDHQQVGGDWVIDKPANWTSHDQ